MQQAIFSQGHDVGKLAQQLFPGGVDAGIYVPDQYQKSIELTSKLIREGESVIYEAGFSQNGLHCFVDILVKDKEGWKAYEVKSSTQVKNVNLLDAAFQYYVMSLCGIKLADISLVVLNTSYTRKGDIDIRQLFRTETVFEKVLKLQESVKQDIEDFFTVLNAENYPDTGIGPHCTDPYDCDFREYCWKHVPDYSVFNISKLSGEKKWELYNMGVLNFRDIPPDFKLNPGQWQQVFAELNKEKHINRTAIRKFVDTLNFPLFFLDFESFQPAVPLFDNSRPYQQIVFQYSLHRLENEKSSPQHFEFLAANDGSDPRLPFIENLIEDIGKEGDILVFNRAFEVGRLNEIASNFPNFQFQISNIVSRIKDLMVVFQQRQYYVPEMKGSYSIKQVLPALVPGFTYDDLAIGDGGSASHAFMSLISEKDEKKIRATRTNLLEYCRQDTLAMVEILKVISSV